MKINKLFLLLITMFLSNPVYCQNAWLIKLLQQENWYWTDLNKYHLDNSEMHIFEINHAVSSIDLAQLIASRFENVFEQIQMIQDSYILNGIYKDLYIQAQVYPIGKTNSRAYISLLNKSKYAVDNTFLNNLLPLDKKIISSLEDDNAGKSITISHVNMQLNELYLYLQKKIIGINVNNISNKFIHTNKYFWLEINLANGKNLQVYANHTKANQTVIATVYSLKAKP